MWADDLTHPATTGLGSIRHRARSWPRLHSCRELLGYRGWLLPCQPCPSSQRMERWPLGCKNVISQGSAQGLVWGLWTSCCEGKTVTETVAWNYGCLVFRKDFGGFVGGLWFCFKITGLRMTFSSLPFIYLNLPSPSFPRKRQGLWKTL